MTETWENLNLKNFLGECTRSPLEAGAFGAERLTPWSEQNTLTLVREMTNWTFNSHLFRSCSLNPLQICKPADLKQTISSQFFYFWVGRCNKTLNYWSCGKQWVLFPQLTSMHWRSQGNKTLLTCWQYCELKLMECYDPLVTKLGILRRGEEEVKAKFPINVKHGTSDYVDCL